MATLFDQVAAIHYWEPIIFRTTIIFVVLSTVSVAIRIIAKLQTKSPFGLDDAFIITAQLFNYVESGIYIHAGNVGKGVKTMFAAPYPEYTKWATIAGMLYTPTVLCISVSVLLFYRRIFPIQSIKRLVTVFLIAHVLWGLATFFGSVFICYPIELAWADIITQSQNMQKCMQYPKFFLATMSLELGLNAAVLALPLKQVLGLQLNAKTRIMLVFVFLLGGVSLITGIIRIYKTYLPGDPYIDFSADIFWLLIHLNTALIAASLPIYRPLMRACVGFMSSTLKKVYGSGYDSKRSAGSSVGASGKGYSQFSDKQSQRSLVSAETEGFGAVHVGHEHQMEPLEVRKGHISVQRTYQVV
ncbi:hypothetical protein M011DRAFT_476458 [Sporormia fimetaria CBS 119925]|uniref:Rhodopsin domain-containing protein n=1 Tax=Sporormia fimetaria CBS 119925 TaxID=1340428 RepID=A0A6A6VF68_9PLEO|nr:hypothetical protein M011DRAFT_476458 [Sporormia fimetaria CBS 119925]